MVHDASFGIIPLKQNANDWYVFIIHQTSGYWGFPKGHQNNDTEPAHTTAARELTEETGLAVEKYLDIAPFTTHYTLTYNGSRVARTVTYFAAIVTGTVTLCSKEVQDGIWLTLPQAQQILTFNDTQQMVQQLMELLAPLC